MKTPEFLNIAPPISAFNDVAIAMAEASVEISDWKTRQNKKFCTKTDCPFNDRPYFGCKQNGNAENCAARIVYY